MGTGFITFDGTASNRAEVNHISAYQPTTSFRTDFRAALDDWTKQQSPFAAWAVSSDWIHRIMVDGTMQAWWDNSNRGTSGANSLTDGEMSWLRQDIVFGAGTATVTWYEGTTDTNDHTAVSYSQVTQLTGLTIAVGTEGSDKVGIGARGTTGQTEMASGDYKRAVMTVDGTVQLDVDFTDLSAAEVAAAQFTEDSVNAATVSIVGSAWTYTAGAANNMMLLGV